MKSDDERWYPADERTSDAGQEGGDAGGLATAIAFGSLAARTGAATWWRVGIPSEMEWTTIGIRRCELMEMI